MIKTIFLILWLVAFIVESFSYMERRPARYSSVFIYLLAALFAPIIL